MKDDAAAITHAHPAGIPVGPLGEAGGPERLAEPLAVPLGRLRSILRRHRFVVLLTFLAGAGLAVLMVKSMPKQFTADVAILVEPQRTQVSDLQAISSEPGDLGGVVRTQIDILRSQTLTVGVAEALHLANVREFEPAPGGLRAEAMTLLQRVGLVAKPVVVPLPAESATRVAAAILAGKISFANEPRSSVLRVLVTTEDPVLSAEICNRLVRLYLQFKTEVKFAAMQRAHEWFQEQLGKLSKQLRSDEADIERYRRAYRLDEQGPESSGTATAMTINRQQLDVISRQLIDVARERARKEGQLAQAEAAAHGVGTGQALPEVMASPVIGQLMAQIATVVGREAQLSASQGGRNPELVATRAQLRRLQGQLRQEIGNVIASLSSDVRAARSQEQALTHDMLRLRGAVADENAAQVGLQALQTKARATRTIYESFLTRATQLANVAGIQEPDASLMSPARVPLGPSGPQSMRIVGVVGFLSLLLGMALAIVIERLRAGFSSPEDIEQALGLPTLATLPTVPRSMFRGRLRGQRSLSFASALDKLRGQMRAQGEQQPKLLMITSALPKEGKSVFVSEVARNAAAAGWRVLLIECDLRCPSLAAHFRLPPGPGLSEILAGTMIGSGTSSIISEPRPGLHLITAGTLHGDPQEQLASKRMAALLAEMRSHYDLVLLDTPPVLPVADALVLAPRADATLLVIRWEKTERAAVQDSLRLLRGSRAQFMGTVLTRVDLRTAVKSGGRLASAFSRYNGYPVTRTARG